MKFTSLNGNSQKLDGGAMFGNAPREVWKNWCPPDEMGRIDLACRSLLVETANRVVLFETGIGNFFETKLAHRFGIQDPDKHLLTEKLKLAGHAPDEVDWVVLSHLHFDHAGGLLKKSANGELTLAFPNAKILVGEEALKRARQPHPRDRASFPSILLDPVLNSGRVEVVKSCQTSIEELPFVEFIYTDGHTPGQMHSLIHGEKEKVFFAGDLIPGTHWVHLPITMGYDRYAEQVIDEKQKVLKRAVEEQWNLFYTHDFNYGASKVIFDGKKFVPENPVIAWNHETL